MKKIEEVCSLEFINKKPQKTFTLEEDDFQRTKSPALLKLREVY